MPVYVEEIDIDGIRNMSALGRFTVGDEKEAPGHCSDIDTDIEEAATAGDPIRDTMKAGERYRSKLNVPIKNYSRHPEGKNKYFKDISSIYDKSRNYYTGGSIDDLPLRLVKDAKVIHEHATSGAEHKIILCVALLDKHGCIKKFAFSNDKTMVLPLRNSAEKLGYDVGKAEVSHAEGQLLQFLYQRASTNPGLYTHILGMGCSRPHCTECNAVLQLVLGSKYYKVSAAIKESKSSVEIVSKEVSSEEVDVNVFETLKRSSHTIGQEEQAVEGEFGNFAIPQKLGEVIKAQGTKYTSN